LVTLSVGFIWSWSSLLTKISTLPAEVRFLTRALGFTSAVLANCPVVCTLPKVANAIELPESPLIPPVLLTPDQILGGSAQPQEDKA
jgi:hypothetical protein